MTNGLSSPKATDRPPGPTSQAARGAPPPSDAFAGILDAHQARTAIAEGQSESPKQPAPAAVESAPNEQDTQTPADGQEDPTAVAAAVLAALPVPVAIPATAVAADPAPTAQMVVAGGAPTPVVQVVTPLQAELAPTVPAVPQTAMPAVAAGPSAVATATAAAADAAPVVADQTATPVPTATAQPEAPKPAAASSAPGQPAADGSGDPQAQADGRAAQTLQQARAAVAYARPVESQQAQAQPAAQAPAPVAPATAAAPATTPATPVTAATPVPLARSAEAVEHVLRLASSRGVTHARIALRPADLGAVDVHIRSTAEGLVARVVAHSAEAVQTLQHAAGDLRRSLEEHGLNLMSLDISQSGESGTGRAGSESDERRAPDGSPAGTDPDDSTTETTTLRLPTGVLVDVLA
jgi:flagellar hook-length control protein FliK